MTTAVAESHGEPAGGDRTGGLPAEPALATLPPADPAPSHRERKKQATRQAIHQAAFDLVGEAGLAHVTIESISERAGVAPRTFWAYFGSKEEAVINRDPDRPRVLREAVVARPAAEDPVTAVRRVVEADMAERFADAQAAVSRQQLIRREPQLMTAVAGLFEDMAQALVEAVAERIGTDPETDMLPRVVVFAVLGACRVAQQRWADAGCSEPLPQLIDEAFDHLAHALAPLVIERRP